MSDDPCCYGYQTSGGTAHEPDCPGGTGVWWGACGVPLCPDCLPRYDQDNREIPEASV